MIRPFRKRIFNYRSIELRDYHQSHCCTVLSRVGESKVLISIDPALPKGIYGLPEDLKLAVLVPRYRGLNFFPSWFQRSMRVNLCIPDKEGTLEKGPWRILDIGDVF